MPLVRAFPGIIFLDCSLHSFYSELLRRKEHCSHNLWEQRIGSEREFRNILLPFILILWLKPCSFFLLNFSHNQQDAFRTNYTNTTLSPIVFSTSLQLSAVALYLKECFALPPNLQLERECACPEIPCCTLNINVFKENFTNICH